MAKNTSPRTIPIWHKIIDKLNKARLRYVLVGGAALIIHGLPRSTLDIDIYVPAREDILNKLFQIAASLGLKSGQKAILNISHLPKMFVNQWVCFSYKGQDILDVFLASENEFKKLHNKSELKKDKKISIRVACLDDIASMKKRSARSADLADLTLIKEVKKYKI